MKTLAFLFKAIPVILISVICLRCDILPNDECDGTKAPEISVGIMAHVHVRGKQNLPIKDKTIRVTFYKTPCGAESKEKFVFEDITDDTGNFMIAVISYNLRNKNDEVVVEAVGTDIITGGISPGNSEKVTFKYDDFIVGITKEVDITLITNE
jgi:hypothetical protein